MKNGAPPLPPGKNAGPAPRSPRLPRGHGHAVCRRMHSRTKVTSAAGVTVLPRVAYLRRQKPEFPQTDFCRAGFFARAGVSEPPRRASHRACATAISRRRRGGRSSRHIYSETGPAGAPDHHALRSSHWPPGAQWAARAEELRRDAVHSFRRRSDAGAAPPSAVAAVQRAHGPHRAVGLRRVQ